MKNVVVDTNILFSAMRSQSSDLRDILLDNKDWRFFSPNFLITEIFKHKEKLLNKSKASEEQVYEFLEKIIQSVHFINDELIATENWIEAYKLCQDIDPKDTPFVALTLEVDGELWTGDLALKNGLQKKGFLKFFEK